MQNITIMHDVMILKTKTQGALHKDIVVLVFAIQAEFCGRMAGAAGSAFTCRGGHRWRWRRLWPSISRLPTTAQLFRSRACSSVPKKLRGCPGVT